MKVIAVPVSAPGRIVPTLVSRVALIFLLPAHLMAQADLDLSGVPVCDGCILTMDRVTTIYDDGGEAGLAGHPMSVVRAGTGDIFLASSRFEPLHFRSTGEFAGVLGRPGEGPGEHSAIRMFSVASDTVYAYDLRLSRRNAWTPDGEYLSSSRIPNLLFGNHVVLSNGSFVISAPLRTPESIGFPLHRFDPSGVWRESFGPESGVADGDDMARLTRLLSLAPDGTLWASHRYEYTLERYGQDGELQALLSRRTEWFPGVSEVRPVSPDAPPLPRIRSMRVDEGGLIWVLVTVAGEDWESGLPPAEEDPPVQTAGAALTFYDVLFDSMIEVIDPASGRVLVSERFEPYLMDFVDGRHVASYREDSLGVPIIDVYALELILPQTEDNGNEHDLDHH